MEIAPDAMVWLTFAAAGGMGVLAIAALAHILDAVFELDPS